ncbi:hypothetical protein, partial [Klebsiella variicola]|uniref:hypothetical protein n=1 Tax=Klebsiella variicola TaxID=244366 RepID=UPI0039C1688E
RPSPTVLRVSAATANLVAGASRHPASKSGGLARRFSVFRVSWNSFPVKISVAHRHTTPPSRNGVHGQRDNIK